MPAAQSKGKSKTGSSSRDARRSRSRNTTPISSAGGVHQSVEPNTTSPSGMQSTLNHLGSPSNVFIEDIFNNGGHNQGIPSPEALHSMLEEVKNRFLPAQTTRSEANEKFMRHLMQRRKARLEHQHAEERADREAEERKHKLKKSKKREPDEDRPPAVGAHGLARQDGTDGKGRSNSARRASVRNFLPFCRRRYLSLLLSLVCSFRASPRVIVALLLPSIVYAHSLYHV